MYVQTLEGNPRLPECEILYSADVARELAQRSVNIKTDIGDSMLWLQKIWKRKEHQQEEISPLSVESVALSKDLKTNEQVLHRIFEDCSDVVFHPIQINGQTRLLLVYIDGLSDTKTLQEIMIKPFLFEGVTEGIGNAGNLHQVIKDQLIAIPQTKIVSTVQEVVENIVKSNIAVLSESENVAIIAEMKAWTTRGVEETQSESSVRGPREGFTETLRTNTSLIRRKIRNPHLKMELVTLGSVTNTDVIVSYIKGTVNEAVLKEVRTRIHRIQIDGILESGYIEELIEDEPFSPFPTIQNTERPDVVASALLEGRIAILVDGTPFALVVPLTFWTAMQAAEDFYERFLFTTAIRFMRFIFLMISLFFPSVYVAITTFHPQMIPTNLLLSFAAAREPSPFPAVVEAFSMEFMFEGLREAGVRLPKAVGSAVSIVGALVIGEAAVQAGIISAPIVIVVATTGIASFAIPRYSFGIAFRLIRFPMLVLAGTFGFYGIAIGLIAVMVHLVSLRSFGVPYLSPVAPMVRGNAKNVLLRPPWWDMTMLPELITGKVSKRMPKGQKPEPPKETGGNH